MRSWIGVSGVLEVIERRQSDSDLICANNFCDSFNDLQGESAPLLNRASICIRANIDIVVKELVEEVTVGTGSKLDLGADSWR
jgi:hypothetical protein